jgi:hypothetical protein
LHVRGNGGFIISCIFPQGGVHVVGKTVRVTLSGGYAGFKANHIHSPVGAWAAIVSCGQTTRYRAVLALSYIAGLFHSRFRGKRTDYLTVTTHQTHFITGILAERN